MRKKIRLNGYDYSRTGCYFVTICVKDRHEMLGNIGANVGAIINRPHNLIELSEYGHIAKTAIHEIPSHYEGITIDKYVIMPNHIHMILTLRSGDDGRLIIAPTRVPAIIQQLKRNVTKQIGFSMWQKSYHDRIIRNKNEYRQIWRYIDENLEKWPEDEYYGGKENAGNG